MKLLLGLAVDLTYDLLAQINSVQVNMVVLFPKFLQKRLMHIHILKGLLCPVRNVIFHYVK